MHFPKSGKVTIGLLDDSLCLDDVFNHLLLVASLHMILQA
jgi:hypothetical protein